jgi:hypothetical protein
MMRHGFVPHGRVDHGNLCGPRDRAEMRGKWRAIHQPPLLLAKSPPYIEVAVVGFGLGLAVLASRASCWHPFRRAGFVTVLAVERLC